MTREAKKITIRNGEVFFPDDGRMEDVSIFRSVVICDCKKDDYDSLVTFLEARSRGVSVVDCRITNADKWAKLKGDELIRAEFSPRLEIIVTPPKVSLWQRIAALFK